MASDPQPVDCIGYGAIVALHGTLTASLEILTIFMTHQERVDIRSFLVGADAMINTIYALELGETWRDARMQFLLLAYRYRDLLLSLASSNPDAFRAAAAEMSEAQTLAVVAIQQLAERLSVIPEQALTV